jgi:ATP-binding cassette subfamily F protein 3
MESIDSLLEAIEAFAGAAVIVTHSEMILHALATKLVVFDNGSIKVFDGTYQDFLDRRGWKDESPEAVCGLKSSRQKGNGLHRKDLKRVRADLINNRSRTLGPLQSRISEVEQTITQLELEIEQETQALITASVKGYGESIRQLSMSIHEAKAKIEVLFDELEMLTCELDAKSREFEERFASLKGAGSKPV